MQKLQSVIALALALSTMLLGLTAYGEKATTETDLTDITLVPFTSTYLGIRGVVPKGWGQFDLGNFVPGNPLTDPSFNRSTELIQVGFPGMDLDQLVPLLLAEAGVDELPPSVGSYPSDTLSWRLYAFEFDEPEDGLSMVDVALAEDDAGAYVVVLQAMSDEYDTLHEAVFLPVVGAFAPLTADEITTLEIEPDYWPTQGWRTSTPEAQGMDSARLAEMLAYIQEGQIDIDSVTVVRNGYIVTDAYFYPVRQNRLHILHSVSKSVTSTLVGIAIDQGYIEGVDQPVLGFFPERTVANLNDVKQAMTLEHLLTMTAGVDWPEWPHPYTSDENILIQMIRSRDWVQFVLDRPMTQEPGSQFNYNSGASFLLSAIIQETTGMSALGFARQHLFDPLGISRAIWPSGPQGITMGWGELRITPHAMAKIGYLFLSEGRWDDEQIVSSEWVEASTTSHIDSPGYGYQWWVNPSALAPTAGYYFAAGLYGQRIFVVPSLDMVVVFTSDLREGNDQDVIPFALLHSFIIPAAQSSTPLPENPDDVARLDLLTEAAASGVALLPPVAERVSGQTYTLEANELDWESVTLTFEVGTNEALINVNDAEPAVIGLNNLGRIEQAVQLGGLVADGRVWLKGFWKDDVFVLNVRPLDEPGDFRFSMTFADADVVVISVEDLVSGDVMRFAGRLQKRDRLTAVELMAVEYQGDQRRRVRRKRNPVFQRISPHGRKIKIWRSNDEKETAFYRYGCGAHVSADQFGTGSDNPCTHDRGGH
ncbi:MAG: serine hydrolase domain-containing protein [Candidatus Bipolaricaulia bacterium]